MSILDLMREQALYLHRQHGWIISVAETIEKHPDLVQHLKHHPTYNQGPREDEDKTRLLLRKVDELAQRLKTQV